MNEDLISRSRLLRDPYFREDRYPVSHHLRMAIMEQPAVDLEQVLKSLPYVKEALEMAKADLVTVVRCKDCKAWKTETAMSFLREGVHVRCCSCGVYGRLMYEDDFCSKGKRMADDAD